MNIQEIRAKYPQYSDMSDADLASALHKKYYADMPFADFSAKVGLGPKLAQPDPSAAIGEAQANPEASVLGMKVQGETASGLNPAAALIASGAKMEDIKGGMEQAKLLAQYAVERLLPFGGRGVNTLDRLSGIAQAKQQHDAQIAKLKEVHPGSATLGEVATYAAAPVKAMPLIGAAEYGTPGERATRAGLAYAGNKATQIAANAVANKVTSMGEQKALNAVRDAQVAAAKEAGYVALPSEVGGSTGGKILEGASGKIKAQQLASVKNQPVTNKLVRQEFNLPEDAPLTLETTKSIRADAYASGYAPLKEWGGGTVRIKPDAAYQSQAAGLTSRSDNASKAFGESVKSDIAPLVDDLKNAKPFTPSEAVDAVAVYREKASSFYAQGNKTAGKAYRDAADIIEGQLERTLSRSGKDGAQVLKDFRQARQTMAKTFDVEKALREGQGSVEAKALGKILRKNPDRLTGNLRTIAQASEAMPQATRLPQQGWDAPLTAVDTWGGTIGSAASGSLLPFLAPAGRVAARYGVLSGPGQRAFTNPNYDPSLLLRGERALLDNRMAPYLGGLLGMSYANH